MLWYELHIDGATRGGYDCGLCLDEKICRSREMEITWREECGSRGDEKRGGERPSEGSKKEEKRSRRKKKSRVRWVMQKV